MLVVDDNPDDRELAARELRRRLPIAALRMVGARDELDAAIEAGGFDVAIIDYQLRWTTGREVLRRLKARDANRPVIMFTASGSGCTFHNWHSFSKSS